MTTNPQKLIKLVIFDIDGCLADDRHRHELLPRHGNGEAKDGHTEHDEFHAYHAAAYADTTWPVSKAVFEQAIESMSSEWCEAKILFFTARPEKYRHGTEGWLKSYMDFEWNAPLFKDSLYMRLDNDKNPSPVVKYNMLIGAISKYHSLGYDVEVICAYDDRTDVLDMYAANNLPAVYLGEKGAYEHNGAVRPPRLYRTPFPPRKIDAIIEAASNGDWGAKEAPTEHNPVASEPSSAPVGSPELAEIAGIFDTMSATLKSRAADYGYNAAKVALVMKALFPNGVKLETAADYEAWHLFELIIVKLTRFVNSGLLHKDSIHDMAIYAGFVERLADKHNIQICK